MEKKQRTLSEICTSYQISRRSIQGYEQLGLIQSTGRTRRGYLLYDQEVVDRILLFRLYQRMGFTRLEIKKILQATNEDKKVLLIKQKELLKKQVNNLKDLLNTIETMIQDL